MKSGKAVALPKRFKPGLRAQVDQRSHVALRVNADTDELVETLGGIGEITPQQAALIERAVWMRLRCKEMEGEYANGQGLDTAEYTQLSNALLGMLRALGLQRRAKPMPRALEYAAQQAGKSR